MPCFNQFIQVGSFLIWVRSRSSLSRKSSYFFTRGGKIVSDVASFPPLVKKEASLLFQLFNMSWKRKSHLQRVISLKAARLYRSSQRNVSVESEKKPNLIGSLMHLITSLKCGCIYRHIFFPLKKFTSNAGRITHLVIPYRVIIKVTLETMAVWF